MPNKQFLLKPESDASKPLKLRPGPQRVALGAILLRKGADTRPLNAKHVLELAESIAVLGLLEPLVIDTECHLLAGGHRQAALQFLGVYDNDRRAEYLLERALRDGGADGDDNSKAWKQLADRVSHLPQRGRTRDVPDDVPVLVVDVRDHDDSGKLALAVELAENNVRRSYTAQEIRDLAARLKKAGYKASVGRPKVGEASAISVLHAAVGKSKRTIERIIAGEKSNEKSGWQNARTTFKRAAQAIIANGNQQRSQEARKLIGLAEKALAILSQDGSQ